MSQWLKQSTAVTLVLGPFVDDTDGKTAKTGLTVSQADVRLSKNGGDFAQKNESTSCTHDENGWYDCPVDATDTGTLGRLDVAVIESGALPVFQSFMVVPANVWDSMFGADALQVHANEITNGLITAAAVATGAIDADALAADAVDKILDEVVEGTTTMRQMLRLFASFMLGEVSGGGTTTITFRDLGDTKARITMTVNATTGDRSAVVLDGS